MGVLEHPGRPVPPRILLLSRLSGVAVAVGYFVVFDVHPLRLIVFLFLPLAIVCFPNRMASATGRLTVAQRVDRPSPPRPLLVLAWALLLFPLWVLPALALFRTPGG